MSGFNDVDHDADTQYGFSRYDDYENYPYSPESAPTAIVTTRSDSSSVIAMAILAAAVMICAAIVVVVVMTNTSNTDTATPAPTTIIRSTVTAAPEPSTRTSTLTPTPVAAPPTVQGTVAPPTVPVSSSLQRLRTQATLDFNVGLNAGSLWVPQLSSKRPGTRDDGIVWDYDDIWQEHQRLRQQYGAILLWSADWSFGADDLWVTVATTGFPTADGARQWCRNHGRDTWHCFPAQLRQ